MTSINSNKFCYTLDVLTDGSEHTGCGTLFLSVWKIPLSIRTASASAVAAANDDDDDDVTDDEMTSSSSGSVSSSSSNNNNNDDEEEEVGKDDPYAWLTGTSLDDNNNDGPVARYALSGVGDATARLCADQRYKLARTRACFLPDLFGSSGQVDGLSALFLALHGAGSPSLHMVVPALFENNNGSDSGSSFIEELATITLGSYKKFDIRTCEVREPPTTCNSDDTNNLAWWRVYEDDYLIVHACSSKTLLSTTTPKTTTSIGQSSTLKSTPSSLLYLYSFPASQSQPQQQNNRKYCTMALLPPKCQDVTNVVERLMEQNLPLVQDGIPMKSIDHILVLDPYDCSSLLSSTSSSMGNVLVTLPRQNQQEKEKQHVVDEGILIRSQQLARRFHSRMPWAFVYHHQQQQQQQQNAIVKNKSIVSDNNEIILKSGTSIILEHKNTDYKSRKRKTARLRIWDRRKIVWNKDIKEEWTNRTLDSLQSFIKQPPPSSTTTTADENEIEIDLDEDVDDENEIEIDLDEDVYDENDEGEKDQVPSETIDENEIDIDDDDDDDENGTEEEDEGSFSVINKDKINVDIDIKDEGNRINVASGSDGPRLIVLGTGCATPSAYRGASAYALVVPSDDDTKEKPVEYGHHNHHNNHGDQIYLLDCGEGTSTMLSRNYGHINDWAQRIRGIWISHAHLDHYGGLPTILRLLHEYRESKNNNSKSRILESKAEEPFPKRPKYSLSRRRRGDDDNNIVPWVIAPAKVLRYLDIVLNCRHGRSKGDKGTNGNVGQYFEPRVHQDPTFPTGPWIHFENIKVNHGCPAFGLLVGWRLPMTTTRRDCRDGSTTRDERISSSQFLCYSGDTRPSHGLVQACRRALQRNDNNYTSNTYGRNNNYRDDPHPPYRSEDSSKKLFLIHEASYQETEANMALKKRHSTINEAFQVACDIPASRVLMTHFSQRYDNNVSTTTAVTINSDTNGGTENRTTGNNHNTTPSLGLAVDGLQIIL
jgi:ribonuclease BN (tRNA processing enzyme)